MNQRSLSASPASHLVTILLWVVFGVLSWAIVSGNAFGVSYERTFTNRVCVLPACRVAVSTTWSNSTAYTQGFYVKNQGRIYMCLKAGTSSNGGSGPIVLDRVVPDGTCEWFPVSAHQRTLWSVQKKAGGNVTISEDPSVTNSQDWELSANFDLLGEAGPGTEVNQGEIYATGTNYTISVRER